MHCSFAAAATKHPISFQSFQLLDEVNLMGSQIDPTTCGTKCQSLKQEFRYVVYVGKQIYCYWDLKRTDTGSDFETLAKTLENSITDSLSSSDYYKLLRRWASSFHDGHVNVIAGADLSGLEIYTAPIRVEVLAPATDHEKVIVVGTSPNVNLAVGDEILTINGVPVAKALSDAAAVSSSGSTERMRRFFAGKRLVDVIGIEEVTAPFVVTAKALYSDTTKSVSLFRTVQIDLKPSATPPTPPTGAEFITAQILPNAIGYLRIDAFQGSQDEYLLSEAMDRLANTQGLIIDLRKNGGGDLSGDRIIERLLGSSVVRYKRSERLSDFLFSLEPSFFDLTADATGQFAAWHDLTVAPNSKAAYSKPVVVLISPYCFSACDTFSAALKGNHLATFVGESTGGGTGTPEAFDLPVSPYKFRYSVIRGETPNGDLIEGNGTSPDVVIEPTAADRAANKDSQLEKALAVLADKIKANGGAIAPTAVFQLPAIWTQSLDSSPTKVENDFLSSISEKDERL